MGINRRAILGALGASCLAGCARPSRDFHYTFTTFTTQVRLSLHGTTHADALRTRDQIKAHFAILNRDWYAWGAGELGQINRTLARNNRVPISDTMAALLQRAFALAELSDGYFDPRIGNLVSLWQLDSMQSLAAAHRIPADAAIQAALPKNLPTATIERGKNGYQLIAAGAGLQLDLGAIAKGAALVEGIKLIRDSAAARALIDIGGDIATLHQDDSTPFRIGLRPARQGGTRHTVHLRNSECIMSSGDYERYWELDGVRYQHIIDPRSGQPVRASRAATVIHDDALVADTAATALMVAGSAHFSSLCDAMQVRMALLVDNDGSEHMTETMRERLL